MNEEMNEQPDYNYDAPQQEQPDYNIYNAPQQERPESGVGFGIASLVLGIIALITFCTICLNVPCAILAIIFGIIQIVRGSGKGLAIVGLITAGFSIVAMIIIWAILIICSPNMSKNAEWNTYMKQYENQFHNDDYNYDEDNTEDGKTF